MKKTKLLDLANHIEKTMSKEDSIMAGLKKANKDYENVEWLVARLREYNSYIKLNDMTFLDDIPKDLAYAEHFFLKSKANTEGTKR